MCKYAETDIGQTGSCTRALNRQIVVCLFLIAPGEAMSTQQFDAVAREILIPWL
jgi:hypothetical protein